MLFWVSISTMTTFVWTVLMVALLVAYMAPAIWSFKKRYDFAQTLPGPSFLKIMRASRNGKLMEFYGECRRQYGKVFRLWLGFDLVVVFLDAEDIKIIANSPDLIDKSKGYNMAHAWLGKGLFTNGGNDWRLKRKLLSPAFNFNVLSTFKEPMEDCCEILVQRLNQVADGRTVNIQEYPCVFAFDVICETAMGIKMNAQMNEESDYVKNTKVMGILLYRQMFSMWKRFGLLYKFTADYKQRAVALKALHGEADRVIKLRRSQLEAETESKEMPYEDDVNNNVVLGTKRRRAFLDSLLLTQRETMLLTDTNIREEVDTFMFAGQDTTGAAISFSLYMLANHPEIQNIAYQEVSTLDHFDAHQTLIYLEAVIKETLRLFPSVPAFSRQTKQPTKIGQYLLPAGVAVNVPVFHVHREAKYFPDPLKFRPERYLYDDPIHPYAHVAFGTGPRNCIGQRFAMLELKCVLTRLLREFQFSAVAGFEHDIRPDLTIRSANGLLVRIHKRAIK